MFSFVVRCDRRFARRQVNAVFTTDVRLSRCFRLGPESSEAAAGQFLSNHYYVKSFTMDVMLFFMTLVIRSHDGRCNYTQLG